MGGARRQRTTSFRRTQMTTSGSRKATTVAGSEVSTTAKFSDEYKPLTGLDFIGKEERHAMIDNATPFTIVKVIDAPARGTYGAKYVCVVELDGETRAISYGKGSGVGSRDDLLESLEAFQEREDAEPQRARMERVGQATIIILLGDDDQPISN